MVVVDFLLRFPKNQFMLLHFNHGTEHGKDAEEFVRKFADEKKLELRVGQTTRPKKPEESQEQYWRHQRYEFFDQFEMPIITAHHLNDCVETWLFTSMRGLPRLIPHIRGNYVRPFLAVPKKKINEWQKRNDVQFVQDPSNMENEHARNIIRNELMPIALKVNPGLEKTIKNKLLKQAP